jgi:flagellar protein FliO/FliZ
MGIGTFLSSLFALFLALTVVLGLAWGFIWLMRKWQDQQSGAGARGSGQSIVFLRSLPLGQRERVTMILVQNEVLLLGVTSGSISLLARWPESEPIDPGDGSGQDSVAADLSRKFSLANFPTLGGRGQK